LAHFSNAFSSNHHKLGTASGAFADIEPEKRGKVMIMSIFPEVILFSGHL
jgi:hypothetical protein